MFFCDFFVLLFFLFFFFFQAEDGIRDRDVTEFDVCSSDLVGRELHWIVADRANLHDILFLGGDPAAGSPTATLLRLNPPYKAQIRHGQLSTMPHQNLIRVVRRAVCARSRDVFTAG